LSFLYLTPCVPLSSKGKGEGIFKRGFASLALRLFFAPIPGGGFYAPFEGGSSDNDGGYFVD